jgi:hypothetical protein
MIDKLKLGTLLALVAFLVAITLPKKTWVAIKSLLMEEGVCMCLLWVPIMCFLSCELEWNLSCSTVHNFKRNGFLAGKVITGLSDNQIHLILTMKKWSWVKTALSFIPVRRGFVVDWPGFNPSQACDEIIPHQSSSIQPGLGLTRLFPNRPGLRGNEVD